jgi:hypothetical protein
LEDKERELDLVAKRRDEEERQRRDSLRKREEEVEKVAVTF